MIRALLFDLDGVLCDLMSLHEEAFLAAVRVEGHVDLGTIEHQAHYAGRSTKQKLQMLVDIALITPEQVSKIAECKQRLTQSYLELWCTVNTQRVTLLQHLSGADYKLGCVTNCTKMTAYEVLRRTLLLPFVEGCIITNEDVKEPKPSPEPYTRACGLLEVTPAEALVFEDHKVGLESAFKAGCYVKQVHTFPELTVDFVWASIEETNALIKGTSG